MSEAELEDAALGPDTGMPNNKPYEDVGSMRHLMSDSSSDMDSDANNTKIPRTRPFSTQK